MEIYFYHTDVNDGEKISIIRGRRRVIVRWNGGFYKLHIYLPEHIIYLLEDYRNSKSTQPLTVMDYTIIMPSIDRESIIKQLLCLEKRNYFQNKNTQHYYDLNMSFHEKLTERDAILKYRDKYYTFTIALNEKASAIPEILIEEEDNTDNIKNRFIEIINEGGLDDIPYTKYIYLISRLNSVYCESVTEPVKKFL